MLETIRSIDRMLDRFLGPHILHIYGSAATRDFRLGWSNINFLCITEETLSPRHMAMLPRAKGMLGMVHPANAYADSFEGCFAAKESLLSGEKIPAVLWGEMGGEATDGLVLDALTRKAILETGFPWRMDLVSRYIAAPTREETVFAIADRCRSILTRGTVPSDSIRAAGSMLDIARCLYTLETDRLISRTEAGYWALGRDLCPSPSVMEQVIAIRECPRAFMGRYHPADFLRELPDHVEAFGRVLEDALQQTGSTL